MDGGGPGFNGGLRDDCWMFSSRQQVFAGRGAPHARRGHKEGVSFMVTCGLRLKRGGRDVSRSGSKKTNVVKVEASCASTCRS